jgi:hypothetical protein
MLWDDGELIDIGATLDGTDQPRGLSARGQVLFSAYEVGAVWEDGETRVLPGAGVTPYLINDRDQVLGTRRASADPAAPTIPTLWEL